MDSVGFWCKRYHRRQLLCVRWGSGFMTESETSPGVEDCWKFSAVVTSRSAIHPSSYWGRCTPWATENVPLYFLR